MTEKKNPEWVQAIEAWQKEDSEKRSVILIATDGGNSTNMLMGYSLPLKGALAAIMSDNDEYERIAKAALEAKKNPLKYTLLMTIIQEFLKKRGIQPEEEDNKPEEISGLSDALAKLISKLADKI